MVRKELLGNLDLAKARQVEAVASYEKTVQGAFRDVSDALVRRRQLALRIDTARSSASVASRTFRSRGPPGSTYQNTTRAPGGARTSCITPAGIRTAFA